MASTEGPPYPRKRTFRSAIAMSALPPKADIRQCKTNVRYGPGNVIVFGESGNIRLPRILVRLEQDNMHARFCEARSNRSNAGAGTDDNVAARLAFPRHLLPNGQNVFMNSISARLSSSLSGGSSDCCAVPK